MCGTLTVFATSNFADNYSPVLFQVLGSKNKLLDALPFRLTDAAINMPRLKKMRQFIAQSPRAQAKFFLRLDDIADMSSIGMDQSHIGRHHVQQSFHQQHRADQLASIAIPSLGGFGVAELEPFESFEHGFQHGHQKKYTIPGRESRT